MPPAEPVVEPTPVAVISVTGEKLWRDEGNIHNTRPGAITVRLYANGVLTGATPRWTGTDGDTWRYSFDAVPQRTADGAEILYTVDEAPVAGYETTVNGTTITNTLIPSEPERYADIEGTKTWVDDENAGETRPDAVTVRLLRNGEAIDWRSVTADDGWHYSFERLPMDDGYGNAYTYAVREDAVQGYYARVTGYDITNTLLPLSVSSTQRMGGETETERVEIVTSVTGEVAVVRPVGDQGDTTGMVSAQRAARIVDRKTGTPPMMLSDATEEEIEELFDMFEYDTPLWGGLLNTGDIAPAWPFAFAFLGALALAAFLLTGRRRRSR